MSKTIEVKGGSATLRVGAGWLSIESKNVDVAYRIEAVQVVTVPDEGVTTIKVASQFGGDGESIVIPIKFSEVMRAIREGS